MNNNRVVLIIPYFGRVPDYFKLWLKSAEANHNYDFFIYSDIDFPIEKNSNVQLNRITFSDIKKRIYDLFGEKVKLNTPYKLCDYKPAYGMIFESDIKEYDFWGFCDLDLIFGNLDHFITDDILGKYDKIFYHGHFSLFKNTKKLNTLFLEKYKGITDFSYASSTNYICHFDEDGTVAHAHEHGDVKLFFEWSFYDVPYWKYEFSGFYTDEERVVSWNDGTLMRRSLHEKDTEIMYVHMQKRKMIGWENIPEDATRFGVYRTEFFEYTNDNDLYSKLLKEIDQQEKDSFDNRFKKMNRFKLLKSISSGALRNKIRKIIIQ